MKTEKPSRFAGLNTVLKEPNSLLLVRKVTNDGDLFVAERTNDGATWQYWKKYGLGKHVISAMLHAQTNILHTHGIDVINNELAWLKRNSEYSDESPEDHLDIWASNEKKYILAQYDSKDEVFNFHAKSMKQGSPFSWDTNKFTGKGKTLWNAYVSLDKELEQNYNY